MVRAEVSIFILERSGFDGRTTGVWGLVWMSCILTDLQDMMSTTLMSFGIITGSMVLLEMVMDSLSSWMVGVIEP